MMHKRLLSILLALVLTLSLLAAIPASAVPARDPSTVTVTFDGNLSDDHYSTVTVPVGGKLKESDLPALSSHDGWHFCGWSIGPYATRTQTFDFSETIRNNMTLYAIWEREIESLDLYIRTPSAGELAGSPWAATVGWYCNATIDTEATAGGYWWDDVSKIGNYGESATFHGCFEAGKTYYGVIVLRPEYERCFTENTTYNITGGAKLYNVSVFDGADNHARLYFSVTIPTQNRIDSIELFASRNQPHGKMKEARPRFCLTSGVDEERIDVWWENLEDVNKNDETMLYGDTYFESGKTYYSYFQLFPFDDEVPIAENPTVQLYGGTVEKLVWEDYGSYSYLDVIYSVQVPQVYPMSVAIETEPEIEYHGGAFHDDLDHCWMDLIDGPNCPARIYTLTAKARHGYYFDGWYDAMVYGEPVLLSRDPVFSFDHDRMQCLICRFKKGEGSDLFVCDTPVTDANAADVLGDGVFKYDAGTKTLTVNGSCSYEGCIIRSSVDGLTVNVTGASVLSNTDGYGTDPTVEFLAATTITGGRLTVKNVGYNCGVSVMKKATLRLQNADVRVETSQYGVEGDDHEKLVVENSTLSVKTAADGQMAIAYFGAGLELIGAKLVKPADGVIEDGSVFNKDQTPASEVLIEPVKEALGEIRLTAELPKADDKYVLDDVAASFEVACPCTIEKAAWYPDGGINPGEIVFEAGGRYFIEVYLRPEAGCVLDKSTKVYINGQPVDNWMQLNVEEWCAAWWYTVPPAATAISEVRLTADLPSVGDKYTYPDPAAKLAGDYHCKLTRAVWYPDGGISGEFVFQAGGRYFIGFSLEADDGYALDETTKVYINDKPVDSWMQVNEVEWSGARWFTFGATGTPFIDIPQGSYFELPVKWAVDKAITKGVDATHFAPDDVCTRAQIVTFLWRAKGCPEPQKTDNPFKDVKADAYYYKAVLWAVENEITNGTGADTFSPDAGCTRSQVVTFLWRSEGKPAPKNSANPFKDVKDSYFYDAVLWAVERQITNGTAVDAFSPDATCTRGQIVTFLYRDIAD
ncbi:MAG: S-layer homology domain-containing protein [Oscillospiraceae bacterium]|nr:S-layer homology domain-containing protein [Oscillospiraceae bacterium]